MEFNMIYTLPIILVSLMISTIFLFAAAKYWDNLVAYIAGGCTGLMSIIIAFNIGSEFSAHAMDLGAIRSSTEIMQYADERVSELEKVYKNKYGVQAPTAALMNSDKPVEGVAKELSIAVKERSQAQRKLLGSKVRISQRKLGFYGFVPAIMGDK